MAETIQEAFLALSRQKGGVTLAALAAWQLDGSLPDEPESLKRLIIAGTTAGVIGVSALSGGIGTVHAESNHVPNAVESPAGSAALRLDGKIDISRVPNNSAAAVKVDMEYPVTKTYDFTPTTARVDISKVISNLTRPKAAPIAVHEAAVQPTAASNLQSNISAQQNSTEVTPSGPLDGSVIGDSIEVMAGNKIPAIGSASNLAISVFAKSGMPFLNPVCENPGNEAECAKTLDGIRMQENHASEMADDKFEVYALGRNKQDRSKFTGDRYVEALEANLQLGDQITGADGVPARKFVLNVASGPGDKAAKAVEERATMLEENADRLGVTIIRWRELAGQHPEWFQSDGVHFNSDGSTALADLIAKTVSETMAAPAALPVAELSTPVVPEVPVAASVAEVLTVPSPDSLYKLAPTTFDISQAYQALTQAETASTVPLLKPDTAYHAPLSAKHNSKPAADTSNHIDITAIPQQNSTPTSLDEYAPGQAHKQNANVLPVLPAVAAVDPPAAVASAEQQPAQSMTPDQLAEALGVAELDRQILAQYQSGGEIDLGPIVDFYVLRPDLAPPLDGFLTYPFPLATQLDTYTISPNTCEAERRVYPDQAAAFKVMTVIYNYEVNNNPAFTGLPPSIPQAGDAQSVPHNEHNPEKPAMDWRTVLIGSTGESDDGPAFEPGATNTDLEEVMVRSTYRFVLNGQPWLQYGINDSKELADRLGDLKRANGKQSQLVRKDHPEHEHWASHLFYDPMDLGADGEVTGQISSYAPCADGAELTSYDEVVNFTNDWAQRWLTDHPVTIDLPTVPVSVPEVISPTPVVEPVVTPKTPPVSNLGTGSVDISGIGAATATPGNIVTDNQAPPELTKKIKDKTPAPIVQPVTPTPAENSVAVTVPPATTTPDTPNVSSQTEEATATLLAYPVFDDEQAIGNNITSYIQQVEPSSPWLSIDGIGDNLGSWIVDESKARNINPLFIVASGKMENHFGITGPGPKNNNYFGMKDKVHGGYLKFDSPQAGIQAFMDAIANNIYGDGANGRYKAAANIYEYFSIHQAGVIAYPGEDLDPTDHSGPGGKPDGDTADGYDTSMNVYISWKITDHPNNKYDGNLYNPLQYYRSNIAVINAITGLALSADNPQRG